MPLEIANLCFAYLKFSHYFLRQCHSTCDSECLFVRRVKIEIITYPYFFAFLKIASAWKFGVIECPYKNDT